jgi:hypothetical protein
MLVMSQIYNYIVFKNSKNTDTSVLPPALITCNFDLSEAIF